MIRHPDTLGPTRRFIRWILVCAVAFTTEAARAATATFAPVGPTTVRPGEDVVFTVDVRVASIQAFRAADVVIGSADATDVLFTYAAPWNAAFSRVTTPQSDVGLYPQDVFVGGNNPTSVGVTMRLGTITLKTNGMFDGTYHVVISNTLDHGISKLSLGDQRDPLHGSATFTIACAPEDPDCDGDFDLVDYQAVQACLQGPGVAVSPECERYDRHPDGAVDLADLAILFHDFTGAQ